MTKMMNENDNQADGQYRRDFVAMMVPAP